MAAIVVATTAACGCDTLGHAAVDVTVQDRVTGQPVPLGGAEIRYENGQQAPYAMRWPATATASGFSVCCTPGTWRIRIAQAGYVPLDTTVQVRETGGQCPRPVLVRLLARLQPVGPGALATTALVPVI